jgi:dienelactone hydrolase
MRPTTILLPLLLSTAAMADSSSTDLDITAADGVRLRATHTTPGKPGPGVLLLHMCNSDRGAWTGLAAELAERGIHSLTLDYRGYGESGGDRFVDDPQRQQELITEKWPGDIDAAFALLRSLPGVDGARLAAGGGSCGVSHSIRLASRHPGDIKALVLLAGSTTRDGEQYLVASPWLPILASASRDDGGAVELTRWTMGFSSHAGNRFLEYGEGGHGTEMFAVHDELEPTIADWYAEHLIHHPVAKPSRVEARGGPSEQIAVALNEPGGPARLLERLREARESGGSVIVPPEGAINAVGYGHIAEGDAQVAIELFELNVAAYPGSANALDSLGDAYLAAGDVARAAEYARRAIEAIPGDESLGEGFATAIRQSAEAKIARAADSD